MDLAKGDVGILEVKFGRTPAIGQVRSDQFHNFHGGSGDVGNAVFAEGDAFVCGSFWHSAALRGDRRLLDGSILAHPFLSLAYRKT